MKYLCYLLFFLAVCVTPPEAENSFTSTRWIKSSLFILLVQLIHMCYGYILVSWALLTWYLERFVAPEQLAPLHFFLEQTSFGWSRLQFD